MWVCVYTQVTIHTYTLLFCQLRQPGSNEHTEPRTLVSDTILQSQAPGLLGQRLIYEKKEKERRKKEREKRKGEEEGGRKEQTKEQREEPGKAHVENVQGTQEPTERAPSDQNWNNLSKRINKVALDYNPKNKLNICESIQLYIKG